MLPPEMEITESATEDIITTSGGIPTGGSGDGQSGNGDWNLGGMNG